MVDTGFGRVLRLLVLSSCVGIAVTVEGAVVYESGTFTSLLTIGCDTVLHDAELLQGLAIDVPADNCIIHVRGVLSRGNIVATSAYQGVQNVSFLFEDVTFTAPLVRLELPRAFLQGANTSSVVMRNLGRTAGRAPVLWCGERVLARSNHSRFALDNASSGDAAAPSVANCINLGGGYGTHGSSDLVVELSRFVNTPYDVSVPREFSPNASFYDMCSYASRCAVHVHHVAPADAMIGLQYTSVGGSLLVSDVPSCHLSFLYAFKDSIGGSLTLRRVADASACFVQVHFRARHSTALIEDCKNFTDATLSRWMQGFSFDGTMMVRRVSGIHSLSLLSIGVSSTSMTVAVDNVSDVTSGAFANTLVGTQVFNLTVSGVRRVSNAFRPVFAEDKAIFCFTYFENNQRPAAAQCDLAFKGQLEPRPSSYGSVTVRNVRDISAGSFAQLAANVVSSAVVVEAVSGVSGGAFDNLFTNAGFYTICVPITEGGVVARVLVNTLFRACQLAGGSTLAISDVSDVAGSFRQVGAWSSGCNVSVAGLTGIDGGSFGGLMTGANRKTAVTDPKPPTAFGSTLELTSPESLLPSMGIGSSFLTIVLRDPCQTRDAVALAALLPFAAWWLQVIDTQARCTSIVVDTAPASYPWLTIDAAALTAVAATGLYGLITGRAATQLSVLSLTGGNMAAVPLGLVENFPGLRELNLSNNQIAGDVTPQQVPGTVAALALDGNLLSALNPVPLLRGALRNFSFAGNAMRGDIDLTASTMARAAARMLRVTGASPTFTAARHNTASIIFRCSQTNPPAVLLVRDAHGAVAPLVWAAYCVCRAPSMVVNSSNGPCPETQTVSALSPSASGSRHSASPTARPSSSLTASATLLLRPTSSATRAASRTLPPSASRSLSGAWMPARVSVRPTEFAVDAFHDALDGTLRVAILTVVEGTDRFGDAEGCAVAISSDSAVDEPADRDKG
jgi:hypothetical protein